jgi:hypothetical protein
MSILGKARPKTLADIEGDGEWDAIFQQYVDYMGGDVKAKHDAWKADPQGDAREALKTAGSGDVRGDFYSELGAIKAWAHQHEHATGADRDRINQGIGMDII